MYSNKTSHILLWGMYGRVKMAATNCCDLLHLSKNDLGGSMSSPFDSEQIL